MSSVQHIQGLLFEIKFFFVVYDCDPNTKDFKDPVFELFQMLFDTLNPGQNTVEAISSQFMNLKPTVFSGVIDSPNKYLVHYVLPPTVYAAYPSNPADVNIADVLNRYRASNPSSNHMTITVNVIEKSENA